MFELEESLCLPVYQDAVTTTTMLRSPATTSQRWATFRSPHCGNMELEDASILGVEARILLRPEVDNRAVMRHF